MVIGAFLGIVMLRAIYGFIPGLLGWLPWIWAAFVAGGGVYTFKGKMWKLCLASSILCIPMSIFPFLALVWGIDSSGENSDMAFTILILLLFLAIAVLPVVSVRLKKREWES